MKRSNAKKKPGTGAFRIKRSLFAGPYIVWMAIFILSPMLLILYYAFTSDGSFTLEYLRAALGWDYFRVLLDSVRFALYTTVLCLLLGYPVAYLLSRMKKSTAALLSVFFIVPMWMNFLLRTYAWKVLLGAFTNILYTESAVLLGMVYNFLPFMVLPIFSVIEKMDVRLIEAAQDLGAGSAATFRRVIFPLSLPGVLSGITMVFIPAVSTFVISRLLGGGLTLLLGDLIEMQFLGSAYNPHLGSAISLVMMVIVLISMAVMNRFGEGEEEVVML